LRALSTRTLVSYLAGAVLGTAPLADSEHNGTGG
jgi:hypothetical protein